MSMPSPEADVRAPLSPAVLRRKWFPSLAFVIVVICTLMQIGCLHNGLVIDDYTLVGAVDGRGCADTAASCFRGKLFNLYYRPMLTSSFRYVQTHHWHNDHPFWYHLENLLLFAVVLSLAAVLFRRILKRVLPALIATAIFGLHPVQVCVTTFIGGRTDLLALVFILPYTLALITASRLWRASMRLKQHQQSLRLRTALLVIFSAACLTGAAFSKEQTIPLMLLLPVFVGVRLKIHGKNTHTRHPIPIWLAVYPLAVGIYLRASYLVIGHDQLPKAPWSAALRVEMVGRSIWYFTKVFLFPTITVLHLSTLGAWDVPQPSVEAGGFLFAVGFVWILAISRTDKRASIMLYWLLLTIFTCINLVPIPSQFASPYRAEIPLFGFAGAVSWLLCKACAALSKRYDGLLVRQEALALALLAPALTWFTWTIQADVPQWHDEMALMNAEVTSDPNFVIARAAYANYWSFPPVPGVKPDYERSLIAYRTCVDQLFGPGVPVSKYAELAAAPAMVRTLKSGSGLRYEPSVYLPQVVRGFGGVYHNKQMFPEAIELYSAAVQMEPTEPTTISALVDLCGRMARKASGSFDHQGVIKYCRIALSVMPDNADARRLLISEYRITGQKAKADAVFRQEDRFTHTVP